MPGISLDLATELGNVRLLSVDVFESCSSGARQVHDARPIDVQHSRIGLLLTPSSPPFGSNQRPLFYDFRIRDRVISVPVLP
jgi:hypothetical protein